MSASYPEITLKRGKEDSLDRRHPWVFSGAIASLPQGLEEGETVKVLTCEGRLIGIGHYQIGSITIRMLDFADTAIDENFYRQRLEQALKLRTALNLRREENDAYRLVHGEGDYLPGLIVDIYGETAVMQAHSPGMHYARQTVAKALASIPQIGIKNVYYKSDATLPYKAQLEAQNDYLIGGNGSDIATENGLKFHIDWLKGQKTGFFLDQRENRSLCQRYARGRKALNLFCYTGGFSCYALRGGALKVVSVDSSEKAIFLTNKNVELNFGQEPRHEAFAEDAFKFLDRTQKGEYDLIVLDPPAFAKHRSAIKNALRGYQRLNAKAFEKIASGGVMFTFSCSQAINKEQFRLAVFSAALQAKRKVRILHQLTQPADHPVDICHPEGEYLKGLVLYVE